MGSRLVHFRTNNNFTGITSNICTNKSTPSPVVLVGDRCSEFVEVGSKRQLEVSEVLENILLYNCKNITCVPNIICVATSFVEAVRALHIVCSTNSVLYK